MVFIGIESENYMPQYDPMLRIRDVRKSKRMTQEDLGGIIGTSQSNISEIEKGKHNPTLETLSKIASALNVNVADLFEEQERDEALSRFLSAYERMPTEERLKIIELAELMARRQTPDPQ